MSTVWICYYGIVSAVSPSLAWLLILRLLVGFGVGGGPQAVTYYSEFLPNKLRGRLIILVEVLISRTFYFCFNGVILTSVYTHLCTF